MAGEFQESDNIFFQSNAAGIGTHFPENSDSGESRTNKAKKWKETQPRKKNKSVPVNIPANFSRNPWFQYYEEDEEIAPPHVIVGRRTAGELACSVCSGNGRTLKGRDLSEVRNSILRMTGFIET